MAETSKPQSPTSSTEMHWGVAYLRQDMRHQVGILHGRVDETNRRIDSRFALLMTAMIAMTGVLLAAIKL